MHIFFSLNFAPLISDIISFYYLVVAFFLSIIFIDIYLFKKDSPEGASRKDSVTFDGGRERERERERGREREKEREWWSIRIFAFVKTSSSLTSITSGSSGIYCRRKLPRLYYRNLPIFTFVLSD